MRRLALIAALAAGALLAAAQPARALPILVQADADELAQTLAEATEEQDVCYGWRVTVTDYGGADSGVDQGSNLGPGRPVGPPCTRSVELVADLVYTSEQSESEDSARWSIEATGIDRPPTLDELEDLGYDTGDLLGADDDTTLVNAVGALPGILADHGEVKPVPFETERQAPDAAGRPTNRPGSDFLREKSAPLALSVVVFLAGLAWFVTGLRARRRPAAPNLQARPERRTT